MSMLGRARISTAFQRAHPRVDALVNAGVQRGDISDGIDPPTKTGRMMLGTLVTLAECERGLSRFKIRPCHSVKGPFVGLRRTDKAVKTCVCL